MNAHACGRVFFPSGTQFPQEENGQVTSQWASCSGRSPLYPCPWKRVWTVLRWRGGGGSPVSWGPEGSDLHEELCGRGAELPVRPSAGYALSALFLGLASVNRE